jgi:hypothetical protein
VTVAIHQVDVYLPLGLGQRETHDLRGVPRGMRNPPGDIAQVEDVAGVQVYRSLLYAPEVLDLHPVAFGHVGLRHPQGRHLLRAPIRAGQVGQAVHRRYRNQLAG